MAKESYSARMKKTGRPVSPHVTIYAFPAAALSSITVRVTGCLLSAGLFGIAGASLVGADAASMMASIGGSSLGPVAKFSVAFPLTYHFGGALRHYIWDNNPDMIQNDQVRLHSIILFASAGVTSLGFAMM